MERVNVEIQDSKDLNGSEMMLWHFRISQAEVEWQV